MVVCLGMCICVLEGGSLDVRETGTALHAGEEGGDEDCVEGEVGQAAELVMAGGG